MTEHFNQIKELYGSDSMLSHLWVAILSIIGHIASDMHRIRTGKKDFSFFVFLSGLVTACFVGVLAFYTCLHFDIDRDLMAVIIGMSAYSGPEGINILLRVIAGRYKINLNLEEKK